MKKILSLVAIAAMMLAMAGCAVNANTGAIVVRNDSDKAVNGLKVGTVNIGHVASGGSTTVYFFTEEDSAEVIADGFEVYSIGVTNKINLKKNYMYSLRLYQSSTDSSKYQFSIVGTEIGGQNFENMIQK